MLNKEVNKLYIFIISIIYASIWGYFDVYHEISSIDLLDRSNYFNYLTISELFLHDYFSSGIIIGLLNEPAFLLINWFLNLTVNDPDKSIFIIITFSAFCAAWFTFSNVKDFIIAIAILFIPFVFVNYLMSLRQGLAVAFFLISWYSSNKFPKLFFLTIAALVHSSFLITIYLLIICRFVYFNIKNTILQYLIILAFILMLLFSLYIMVYLNIRQAEVYNINFSFGSIGLGLIFWILILIILANSKSCDQSEPLELNKLFLISALLLYIICYIFSSGIARTIQNHALLILIFCANITGIYKFFFRFLVLVYFLYTFYGYLNGDLFAKYSIGS